MTGHIRFPLAYFLRCLCLTLLLIPITRGVSASEWRTIELPSRPINIAQNKGTIWTCGADELIAKSTDGGKTWSIQHSLTGGGILLTIGFPNESLGYAGGTRGSIFLTRNGGDTWSRIQGPADVIYALSFSDEKNGIVHTRSALYTTSDGGLTWAPVRIDFSSDEFKEFSHVSTVVALDARHMAIVLSQGNASYYAQKVVITKDGGASWNVIPTPNTALTSLTAHDGEYWFAGMEVIEKDKPGGGYGVPLLMRSADGEKWDHLPRWSQKEFSVCNVQGCLYWDGAGVELPPATPVNYWTFAPEKVVTARWAVGNSDICTIATNLMCTSVTVIHTMPPYTESSSTISPLLAPPALDAPPSQGLQCISCDVERVIVTNDFQGVAEVELKLHVAQSGLVEQVEVVRATRPEIGERLAGEVRSWIFIPYEKDGVIHPAITNVKLRVQAIKSK